MKVVLDANIVIRAVVGKGRILKRTVERGLELVIPEAQLVEAIKVLELKFGMQGLAAREAIQAVSEKAAILEIELLLPFEAQARARLEPRGQSDWPVLAAALLLDADIWSDDRDFFGVGVPLWTTRNIQLAGAA